MSDHRKPVTHYRYYCGYAACGRYTAHVVFVADPKDVTCTQCAAFLRRVDNKVRPEK